VTEPLEYKIKDYTEARDVINQMIGPFEMLRVLAKNYGERSYIESLQKLSYGMLSIIDNLPPAGTYVRAAK
jgi:hypothetical protein